MVGVHLVGGVDRRRRHRLPRRLPGPLDAAERRACSTAAASTQLGKQVLGPVAVGVYSFVVTWIIGKIIDKTMGFRISEEDEVTGIDITTHAETAYDLGTVHASGVGILPPTAPVSRGTGAEEGGRMKLITAVIKPFKLDDVKAALERSASRA